MYNNFLHTVAGAYRDRYADLSSLTFVMPNKRSGSFLLKAFSDLSADRPVVAPRVLSVADFIASVADNVADSRIDLLFRLYVCYLALPGAPDLEFEKFSSWGEIILSDFNEIDMQMVDASEIFKNVYDLNAIRSNFLNSAQRKVMVDYFGYSPDMLDPGFERFWQRFDDPDGKSPARGRYLALWQLLAPLYKAFKDGLAADGLSTLGGTYREAAAKIEAGFEPFPGEKIVFVGFNALSVSESRIFAALRDMELPSGEGKADFIWDLAPAVFADPSLGFEEPALKYVAVNSRRGNFPPPGWLRPALDAAMPRELPSLTVISVPSNVMQTKIAGMQLAGISEAQLKDARIAVVLPDENLLLPLLYSLPPEIRNPNLTMGFPLRQTPVIGFASLLRRLHQGVVAGKDPLFHFEDVKDFLAHPFSRLLFPRRDVERFIRAYEAQRRVVVPLSSLLRLGDRAAVVFRVFGAGTPAVEIVDYLLYIMAEVNRGLSDSVSYLRANVEKVYIGTYTDALIRLRNCISGYGVSLSVRDVFMLADRLIAGESVVFDGQPLEGLQIMGVLETRCLDFDRVIMLSVNEKVMPRVGRNSSFIPNMVRGAFGMPPANYQEELFAYYFFRVVGRCSSAVLTYDSRSSENRTPGPSRYLLQLKYLVRPEEGEGKVPFLREIEARFALPRGLRGEVAVGKSGDVMECLGRYVVEPGVLQGGLPADGPQPKRFSASALNHYFQCPLHFLYADVLRLGEEREKIETIDAIDLGTIVHQVMEHLYFPPAGRGVMLEKPLLVTPEFLRGLLDEKAPADGETRIERETRLAILEVHFGMQKPRGKLRGSPALIYDYVMGYVRKVIEADLFQAPFRLWGSEIVRSLEYPLPDGRTVLFTMIIDRLDQEGESGAGAFRIVDYKTGNVHVDADGLGQVIDGTSRARNIFQLFFYAELLVMLVKRGEIPLPEGVSLGEFERDLRMVLYCIPSLPSEKGFAVPTIVSQSGVSGEESSEPRQVKVRSLADLRMLEEEAGFTVMGALDGIISDILDPSAPFVGCPSDERCALCEFRLRCETMRARRDNKL